MSVCRAGRSVAECRAPSLSAVRQQIRRKLIEVGLQVQGNHKKSQNLTQHKQKSRYRPADHENLPLLHSHRHLPLSDFKQAFAQQQDNYSHCEDLRKFSKEVVIGKRCHQTIQTSRQKSPCSIKQSLLNRVIDTSNEKQDGLIPWFRKFEIFKNSKSAQVQPLSIARLFQTKNKQQASKLLEETANKRSKTEERESYRQDKYSEAKIKQITPWQFQIARDTLIYFQ